MRYDVYQIWLSGSCAIAAASEPDQLREFFLAARTRGEVKGAVDIGLYNHVCYIEANSLGEVFEIGNIGPEKKIVRLDRMSAIPSVTSSVAKPVLPL